MRLRRLELVVIGLTLAFVCFLGGYFTGSRTGANVVSVASQDTGQLQSGPNTAPGTGDVSSGPGSVSSESHAETGAGTAGTGGATGTGTGGTAIQTPEGSHAAPSEPDGSPRGGDGRININLASRSELMDLPGIGNVLAERIVEYRRLNGYFQAIEDIKRVSGIGDKRFETIRDRITVG